MSTAALKAAENPQTFQERTRSPSIGSIACSILRRIGCASASARTDGSLPARMEEEQRATHGLAWLATYVESLRQLDAYARRLTDERPLRRSWRQDRSARLCGIRGADLRRHPDEPG
jgi:(2S)-methylsuccinyl-CoA dehydrogenase